MSAFEQQALTMTQENSVPSDLRHDKDVKEVSVISLPSASKADDGVKSVTFEDAVTQIGRIPQKYILVLISRYRARLYCLINSTFVLLGFGKVQMQLVAIVSLVLVGVLNETMGISFLIPPAQCDLNLSTGGKGLLSSMVFFGEIFGHHNPLFI